MRSTLSSAMCWRRMSRLSPKKRELGEVVVMGFHVMPLCPLGYIGLYGQPS